MHACITFLFVIYVLQNMSKRVATENTDDNSSPAKRFLSSYEMVNLGRIRSLVSDLDYLR